MAIAGAQHGLGGRGSFNVDIKIDGNWVKFNRIADSTPILMAMAAREGQKKFAEAYRDAVKENIRNGGKRFGYPPLSWAYLYRKMRMGGTSDLLKWSETMLHSVNIRQNSEGTRWMVGIPKGLKRPNYSGESSRSNRLQVHEYANVLEHGTRGGLHIPPRPVFADTFRENMKGLKGLRAFIELYILKRFGTAGIIVNKI